MSVGFLDVHRCSFFPSHTRHPGIAPLSAQSTTTGMYFPFFPTQRLNSSLLPVCAHSTPSHPHRIFISPSTPPLTTPGADPRDTTPLTRMHSRDGSFSRGSSRDSTTPFSRERSVERGYAYVPLLLPAPHSLVDIDACLKEVRSPCPSSPLLPLSPLCPLPLHSPLPYVSLLKGAFPLSVL